jgi:hypothetical protein
MRMILWCLLVAQTIRKRVACVYKSVGNLPRAIELLVEYVQELYPTDASAWHELAELYIAIQRLDTG